MVFNRKLGYRKPSNKGGGQYTISLPKQFIDEMGISENDRDIILYMNDKKQIIIEKRKEK